MKRSVFALALSMGIFTMHAQNDRTALEGTRPGDNWSIELKTGAVTPLTHSAFFKNVRPAFGVGIGKQLTPIFGLGIQGMGYVNTTASKTAFDASEVSVFGKVNLMNLFGSYTGEPRIFEIEALTGIGWLHYYQNGPGDTNSWSTRLGLNLNFNLGEEKAWTFGIKPAVVYDMQGDFNRKKSRFNANNAAFELTAGLTYHFMCSNGTHHFTTMKPYDPVEIGELFDLRRRSCAAHRVLGTVPLNCHRPHIQRLQDQTSPQTEAQDEIFQSQSASNLVLRVDEPQQQTVGLALRQFGELLLTFLRLLHRFHQGSTRTDLAVAWRGVPIVQFFQYFSHGVPPPCQQHTIPQKRKTATGTTFCYQNIHNFRQCSNRLKNGPKSPR